MNDSLKQMRSGNRLILSGINGAIYEIQIMTLPQLNRIKEEISKVERQEQMQKEQFLGFLGPDSLEDQALDDHEEENEPLYPGVKWRDQCQESGILDHDYLVARYGLSNITEWYMRAFSNT
jgi:hypothetical protein